MERIMKRRKSKEAQNSTKGWISSDQDEIERRRLRGRTETMKIDPANREHLPFTTFIVSTKISSYTVEIRSFHVLCNSCNCPDYLTNELGTCKHIEGVLHRTKGKKKISPFTDIYFTAGQVRILWPLQSPLLENVKTVLSPYFSANDSLLTSDISSGIATLQNAIMSMGSEIRKWVRISAHLLEWLEKERYKTSRQMKKEEFLADVKEGKRTVQVVSSPLYPYQEEGMLHLAFQGRAILADEMGLGKTIQAIAAAELLRRLQNIQRVLIVCPTSLKGEWEEQIAKFTLLPTQIINGTRPFRFAAYRNPSFFNIVNYEQARNDVVEIQQLLAPDLLILDEAQRVKNWNTQTAASVKKLHTPYVFVLTGTPIENRIDDIYSIMQVINPQIFGPLFKFNREFYKLDDKGKAVGYKNLEELHRRLHPVLLRRLKKDVEEQLPERTVNHYFVKMTAEQQIRYDDYSTKVAKLMSTLKRRPLTVDEGKQLQQWLACMRMIADTPYILDSECRDCPKLEELEEILTEICQNPTNKIILFSEWERMLFLIRKLLDKLNISYAWHTGNVRQDKRREEIKRFKEDPACRCFLSTDAGSTGLNLQVANTVINVDLPWNPAKLEQRIARAWRKHQTRAVQVINLVCEDSIESRMLATLAQKQQLATGVLEGDLESDEMDLASGRSALVEKLKTLLGAEPTQAQEPTCIRDSATAVKNDLLSRFTDRIHLLQLHTCSKPILLAVVDQRSAETESQIHEVLRQNYPDSPPSLALFDQATYKTILKLSENGVISFNQETSQTLHRSAHYEQREEGERQKQLVLAKQYLAAAERKMAMSTCLTNGEFFLEAVAPASEALALGMKCLSAMKIAPEPDFINLQSRLTKAQSPEETQPCVQSVREYLEEISQNLSQLALR
jgi:hypothetical protein